MKNIKNTFCTFSFLLIMIFTASSTHGQNQKQQDDFFQLSDSFFSKYVSEEGKVDYAFLSKDPSELNQLVDIINHFNLTDKKDNYIKAYYTNTYNIMVIKQVVDNYPIKGPLEVDGFFDKNKFTVSGEQLTLNQIEKDKNLYINNDERLHFALVCAAVSCPSLANFAYTPEKIEEQLNQRTIYALNDENFIQSKGKKISISQIFNWYASDFKDKDDEGIVGYIINLTSINRYN